MNTLNQLASMSAVQVDQANAQRDSRMLADDFDTFLQLLTTQLRNQDPLEPMDTNEFTNQLVQFSSVEQQIQTNSYLESLISSSEAQAVNAVVGYLGSTVTAGGVATNLADGEARWTLMSTAVADDSTVTIFDENGQEVFSTSHSVDSGFSTFTWDGTSNSGQAMPEGVYMIRVEGRNGAGRDVNVQSAVSGVVDGIDVTGDQPMLRIGDVWVRLQSVLMVETSV